MHRSVLVIAAAAFALGACDSGPTSPDPAFAAPSLARNGEAGPPEGRPAHQNTKMPFAFIVMNPCPPVPEAVYVEGTTHYNAHFKFVDGGNNARLMRNTHATGIGSVTLAKYQFHQLERDDTSYDIESDRYEVDRITRYHAISEGPYGNFFATVRTRIVFNQGIPTIEVTPVESHCRG